MNVALPHCLHILSRADPAFSHSQDIEGNGFQQVVGDLQACLKSLEVSIIDADKAWRKV